LLPLNHYFWCTYDQQEVDLIEVQNQEIKAFECKWSAKSSKAPVAFSKIYPAASFTEINNQNFINFIT